MANLFLDPTGSHLFIALATKAAGIVPELLYLHRKGNRPKKVEKFRDHEITAVAFNHTNESETSTGSILIGTSKGLIFETEMGMEGEKMFQSCWKQVSRTNGAYISANWTSNKNLCVYCGDAGVRYWKR